MREKFLHAYLIPPLLEIHVYQEVLRVLISIGSFEHHFDVIDCAYVSLTNVNNNAWVLVLNQNHFVCLAFGLERYVWLRDY